MNSEQNIIDLLKRKDKQAIALLYDRFGASLYGVVLRIVGSKPLAEDVIQDTFIKVWKKSEQYNPDKGSLFTWLLNIARNTAIDKVRSSHYKHQKQFQPFEHSISESNAHSLTINTDQIGLRKVVDDLDEKYRVVIDLVYFKGYTQKEVEEELQIPIGTVKTRVKIGLRELRKVFSCTLILISLGFFLTKIATLY